MTDAADKPSPTLAEFAPNAIDLSPHRTMCARHGEIFREAWPTGALVFQVLGVKTLLMYETFADAVGATVQRLGDTSGRAFQNAAETLLDTVPMCCRLKDADLLDTYMQSGLDPDGKTACVLCGKIRRGAPYRTADAAGVVTKINHLCFACVVFNVRSNVS